MKTQYAHYQNVSSAALSEIDAADATLRATSAGDDVSVRRSPRAAAAAATTTGHVVIRDDGIVQVVVVVGGR